MRIYLVGFMGTGKTTVGEALARRLRYDFRDLDRLIEEREGRSVREIFAASGEAAFRQMERQALRESVAQHRLVMATGGGAFCQEGNRRWIGRHGLSVWLDPPFAEIVDRLESSGRASRPLFADVAAAKTLFERRQPMYAEADVRQTLRGGESTEWIIESILNKLRERQCEL